MKLEDINEDFYTRFQTQGFSNRPPVTDGEIFKNPSKKEIKIVENSFATRDSDIPGFLHLESGDLYIFKPYILHSMVADSGKIPQNSIGIRFYHDGSDCEVSVTDYTKRSSWHHNPKIAEAIYSSYLSKLYQIVTIDYYDGAIVGDWSEL